LAWVVPGRNKSFVLFSFALDFICVQVVPTTVIHNPDDLEQYCTDRIEANMVGSPCGTM
jgi:hypothetical protein